MHYIMSLYTIFIQYKEQQKPLKKYIMEVKVVVYKNVHVDM